MTLEEHCYTFPDGDTWWQTGHEPKSVSALDQLRNIPINELPTIRLLFEGCKESSSIEDLRIVIHYALGELDRTQESIRRWDEFGHNHSHMDMNTSISGKGPRV